MHADTLGARMADFLIDCLFFFQKVVATLFGFAMLAFWIACIVVILGLFS